MVIDKITGGKPQEIRKTEQAEKSRRAPAKEEAPRSGSSGSATAEVSERSRAAIKAYRIASETKPDISRAARVAAIKAQVMQGSYSPSSVDVADAILKDAAGQ
ncbi:MAG: flagellar biosynthesis anti-sigma factor FlgM [Candidatus Nitrospinota bacterium M3_3B_026]